MNSSLRAQLHYLRREVPGIPGLRWRLGAVAHSATGRKGMQMVAAAGWGLVLGGVVVLSTGLTRDWAGIVLLATVAPTVALLVRDIEKLLLIALIVDIPLGLDFAIWNRPGHRGGPGGFLVSLTTIVLVVGYARWLMHRPRSGRETFLVQADLAVPALFYLFAVVISAFQATDVWYSVTQLFLDLQFVLTFFYLTNHVRTWSGVRLISTTLVVCVLLAGMVMLAQYYTGFEFAALAVATQSMGSEVASAAARVGGTLGGANLAATFLAASLGLVFALSLGNGHLVNTRLSLSALLVGAVALLHTQSRGGWLAGAVAILIVGAQALRRRIGLRRLGWLALVGLLAGLAFAPMVTERFTTDDRGAAESRLWYSELALNVIREQPWTGVGANNQRFAVDDDRYAPQELLAKDRTTIHNTYLAVGVETGVFGLFAFVWLLLAGARRALIGLAHSQDRHASIVVTGLLAALLAFMAHIGLATYAVSRMRLLWLLLAMIAATSRIAGETQAVPSPLHRAGRPTKRRRALPSAGLAPAHRPSRPSPRSPQRVPGPPADLVAGSIALAASLLALALFVVRPAVLTSGSLLSLPAASRSLGLGGWATTQVGIPPPSPSSGASQIPSPSPWVIAQQTSLPTRALASSAPSQTSAPSATHQASAVPTSTRTPTRSPTWTASPSASPTPTATPTATTWRTLTPSPTATPTLSPLVLTPVDVPPPTATRLPAPVLLSPAEEQTFSEQDDIILRWEPVAQPGADVHYAIRVTYSHMGETWHDETPWITDTAWLLSEHRYLLHLSDDGRFCWAVQAMRRLDVDPEGMPLGEPLSPLSPVRCFVWHLRTGEAPTPTAQPSPTATKRSITP